MAARLRKHYQEGWKWYVYKFYSENLCVYVGKGSGNRFKNQRKRFCEYEGRIVAYFEYEKDALCYEKAQIIELSPQLNKALMPETPSPWKVRLLPEYKDFNAWCTAIGTRAMAARLCLRHWTLVDKSKLEMIRSAAYGKAS